MTLDSELSTKPLNFLEHIIQQHLADGCCQRLTTRFPPEPNGYLHIGHAKSICLNFGLAQTFGGQCHLRFDDTNPAKEEQAYIDAIIRDIQWLGFTWAGEIRYSSDYFQQLYTWALDLIEQGKAYVCHLSAEQTRLYRGTLTEAGKNSPYRERSIAENLVEFEKMRAGDYAEGTCVLRAKIDMASPNINLRDPTLYRIRKQSHHQTGDHWCIYPTYDFAHGQGDALERVSHSICTLEFQDHRPLYDWFIANLPVPAKPKQYEFGRLQLSYTITSKRKLKQLVDEGHVDGWDDPRMPTIAGLRRRGVSAAALRKFCDMIGVTKSDAVIDIAVLEHAVREDLDKNAPRAMCVLNPVKITLTNYPEGKTETLVAPGHPQRDDLGERQLPFSRTLFIDAADFREQANKQFKRLVLGKRVRLRNAYVIEADDCVKDAAGNVREIKARFIEGTVGNNPEDGSKPKGVIHWVDATINTPIQVNLYECLFTDESPDAGDKDFLSCLNPQSLRVLPNAIGEIGLAHAPVEQSYQFEREGYFCRDNADKKSKGNTPVFNQTISLRDSAGKKVS